jgi:hypothetical protein
MPLTSPTGCGRSVGIVRLRTKTTEFSLKLLIFIPHKPKNFKATYSSAYTDYDGTSKVLHRRDRAATSSSLLFGIQHIQEFEGAKKWNMQKNCAVSD